MTNQEYLQSILASDKLEEFVTWLDEYGAFDGSPWMEWFNKEYCKKCESIGCTYNAYWGLEKPDEVRKVECSYCELEGKCRFFPNYETTIDNKDIIKLWLMAEHT